MICYSLNALLVASSGMPFQHEKLTVYQRSLDFIVEMVKIVKIVQGDWADLIDQLKRTGTSIVLNIAEGAAEFRPQEKARFYRMAIRSAAECHAALEILARVGAVPREAVTAAKQLLEEIAAMLVAMCKQVESRSAPANARPRSRSRSPEIGADTS